MYHVLTAAETDLQPDWPVVTEDGLGSISAGFLDGDPA